MGLTKDVKDFFAGKINAVLDARLENVSKGIDNKAVDEHCLKIFLKSNRVETEYNELIQVKKEISNLKQKEVELTEVLGGAIKATKGDLYHFYGSEVLITVKNLAKLLHKNDVLAVTYPDVYNEIVKIKAIQDDVQGVILLATTESKLVERLTKVLNKYGGDIGELLEMLPKD